MTSQSVDKRNSHRWTIEEAERLLSSLTGVLSARIVARPGGEIEEVHVLTTESVAPKQTVRNVESALLAHFDLSLDHRKISVAQTSRPVPRSSVSEGSMSVVVERYAERGADRILFRAHRMESEEPHRIRVAVSIEWREQTHQGMATGADLPRSRLETTANATLRAIEAAVATTEPAGVTPTPAPLVLALDGVKLVEAFDRQFTLVAVNAMSGRYTVTLSGAASTEDNLDRSVVLATLQATDRWVRGKIR